MKQIINAYALQNRDTYRCFGCSPQNPIGLHMTFALDGDVVVSEWEPRPGYEGYANVLHGGIQATMADEEASWALYAVAGTCGVTKKLEVEYLRPLHLSLGKVVLRGRIVGTEGRDVTVEVEIANADGVVCSRANVVYSAFPPQIAAARFNYPGREAFVGPCDE